MKIISKALFLSLVIAHYSYSMNKTEEEMFHDNLLKLSEQMRAFVQDFQTWPKNEQDKIRLSSNSGGVSFQTRDEFAAADKYDGNVNYWFECWLTKDQSVPFFLALDYVKKQNKSNR